MRDGWAAAQRRRGGASRIAAAIALHALVLLLLTLAIDRVELPRRGADRTTTLLNVVLHAAPPPAPHAPARLPPPARTNASAVRAREARAVAREPVFETPSAITLPAPAEPAVVAATPTPAPSSPSPEPDFRDSAATRQAIRAAGRGETLASRANALTHEDPGSELLAADGSHCNCKRNLPPPPPAQALAQDIAAAHKNDCLKGEYAGSGMGLLSAPFLLAAEAMGKCAHKL